MGSGARPHSASAPQRLIVLPDADADLQAALRWYDERSDTAGDRFLHRIDEAMDSILTRPASFPCVYGTMRRVLLHQFPYKVYFSIEGDAVVVFAILHGSRRHRSILRERRTQY